MADKEKTTIDWGYVFKVGLILFVITLICTLLLAITNSATAPVIAKQLEETSKQAQKEVLPEATDFKAMDTVDEIAQNVGESIIANIYVGTKNGETIGYAVETKPSGYGGEIDMLTGISTDGKITGVKILSQSETAGLGAKSTEPAFYEQYTGLDALKEVTVIKSGSVNGNQIMAITGATITSNAVTTGVNAAEKAVQYITTEGAQVMETTGATGSAQ